MDFAILSADIYTQDPVRPCAQAIKILNGCIEAVGTNDQIKKTLTSKTRVMEMPGKLIIPGLTDSHIHFISLGQSLNMVDLRDLPSWDACRQKIKTAVKTLNPGQWIIGRGWNQNMWQNNTEPVKEWLDDITPENPAMMVRVCGHNVLANSLALEKAGIDKNSVQPPGGRIDKDPYTNEPVGLIRESIHLIEDHIPPLDSAARFKAAWAAQQEVLRFGITGIHSIEGVQELKTLKKMNHDNVLKTRVYHMIQADELALAQKEEIYPGKGNDKLWHGHVKLFADGSLGACTALLHEPYNNSKNNYGIPFLKLHELEDKIRKAYELNWNVAIHAIGDKAVSNSLEAISRARQAVPGQRRDRIEHLQLFRDNDLARIKDLEIIASVQPGFIATDMDVARDLWGVDRCQNGYAWKTLMDKGIPLQFGSDSPVEPANPLLGIQGAVTRQTPAGKPGNGWFPNQRLSLEQAIAGYTQQPAVTSKRENVLGSLTPGKWADMTIFEENLFKIPPLQWHNVPVAFTVVNGEFVYEKKD
ncbi:MAG: amidohydrolase [Desulfobacteraceae bacterium]|nr:amidohydrolase [Desulfobacteraceae bacterium]